MLRLIILKLKHLLGIDSERYQGLVLPTRRSNQGMSSNRTYLDETAAQLASFLGKGGDDVKLLDFGCGQGRLLNGIMHGGIAFDEYIGLDVDPKSLAWCVSNLAYDRNIAFVWYNQANARYNAAGESYDGMPVKDGHFTHVFSNSVFSHLDESDVVKYARLIRASVANGGRFYLTAFTEEGVEPCVENPDGYMGGSSGDTPLHRVRFNKDHFIDIFTAAGWTLEEYRQNGIARTGQSELVFRAG